MRLSYDVTALHMHADATEHNSPPTREPGRSSLDASVQRELWRGEAASADLSDGLRVLLDALVRQELRRTTAATADSLLAATPIFGPFRTARFQHRLEQAIKLGFARRDRSTFHPTVAGIAVIFPPSVLAASEYPQLERLRELRVAEIGEL